MASLFFDIYPTSQISAGFEAGQPFGFYRHRLAGPWIAPGEWFVGFDLECTQAPDIDAVSFGQGIGHGTKYQLDDLGGFGLGKILLLLEGLDQLALIHCENFPLSFCSLNINTSQDLTGPGLPAVAMVIGTMLSILNTPLHFVLPACMRKSFFNLFFRSWSWVMTGKGHDKMSQPDYRWACAPCSSGWGVLRFVKIGPNARGDL
jgi:hypothetical protein